MKRPTLQDQYTLLKEGKGHEGIFLNDAKRQFPQFIPNQATFKQASNILKQKNIISENVMVVTDGNSQPDWFKIFEDNVNEVKAVEKKTTKAVEEMETAGYDYKDDKNINNQISQEVFSGLYCELKNHPELTLEEAKEKVMKNLEKNKLYYVEECQFGVEGIGYVTEAPGLGESIPPKGEYKASGYGTIPSNMQKVTESKKLRDIVRSIIKEELKKKNKFKRGDEVTSEKLKIYDGVVEQVKHTDNGTEYVVRWNKGNNLIQVKEDKLHLKE